MDKNEVLENMKKIYRCMQMEARGCSNQCSTCEFFVSAPQRGSTVEAVIAMWEPSAPTAVEYIYTVVAENERKRGYEQAKAEYDHKLTEIKSRIKDHYYNKGYEQGKKDAKAEAIPLAWIRGYIVTCDLFDLHVIVPASKVIKTMVKIWEQENPGAKKGE